MQSAALDLFSSPPQPSLRKKVTSPEEMDRELVRRLRGKTINDPLYWSLPNRDRRQLAHSLFQYPAMMVPEVQRRLIEVMCRVNPDIVSLYDPFVGSGTSLVAGMRNGLMCAGQDINPLAILLARVKTQPFRYRTLLTKVRQIVESAKGDKSTQVAISFPGIDKWFRADVQRELSQLRRSICQQPEDVRPFFWVILAETIRLTSNDRTSTYKLHARPKDESQERLLSPIVTFNRLATRGCQDLKTFHTSLVNARLMVKRHTYKGQATVVLADTQEEAVNILESGQKYDLLITSPPYGDNLTTVPYGQHSYLALQWIDLSDIDSNIDRGLLYTTQEIDRRSLGGSVDRKQIQIIIDALSTQSATLGTILSQLADSDVKDSTTRVIAFYNDLNQCIDAILPVMNPNAYMCWTVANRRVSNIEIPIHTILTELLANRNVKFVATIDRTIHHKRMPSRNKTADTMKQERILIFRTNE